MKKQLSFMAVMMILGVLSAALITVILGAIAVPTFDSYLLTLAEHQDYKRMWELFGPLGENADPLLWFGAFLSVAVLILLIKALNPWISLKKMRSGRAAGKTIVIILAVLLLGTLYTFLTDAMNGIVWQVLFAPLVFGAIWLIVGEAGWAGNLASWKYEHKDDGPGISGTMIMGALWGLAAGLLGVFVNQAFDKYFIVVSEVLDGTGETSYTGFLQLFAGEAVLLSLVGGILIGLAFPLAPPNTDQDSRKKLLLPPGILVLILLLTVGGGNLYAVARYDLGTKSLAEAAGLSDEAPEVMTLVNLSAVTASEPVAREWPLEVRIWGMAYSDTITISKPDLDILDDFIERKRGGSVYQYPAMDTRIKGSFVLFDVPGAEKGLQAYSRELILPRMIQLHRLRFLPVTPENRNILLGYTDEEIWHIPGGAALRLAWVFDHFGMPEDAKKWFERARSSGTDLEGFEPSGEPLLTDGTVSGSFMVESDLPGEVLLGLMHYRELGDEGITVVRLQQDLLATTRPDDSGAFTFQDLGSGEYRLVALLPEQLNPATIEVTGETGIIELSRETSEVELGAIEVSFQ
jgi:hypothetical protein